MYRAAACQCIGLRLASPRARGAPGLLSVTKKKRSLVAAAAGSAQPAARRPLPNSVLMGRRSGQAV
eukprot:COSAG06_NODE_54728_length_293_cov_0.783505_1_plen_65_part_10